MDRAKAAERGWRGAGASPAHLGVLVRSVGFTLDAMETSGLKQGKGAIRPMFPKILLAPP